MRRANRIKPTCGSMPPAKSPAAYTAEQRDRMQRGLRILARMIARAHLRREASRAEPESPEPPLDGGAGG